MPRVEIVNVTPKDVIQQETVAQDKYFNATTQGVSIVEEHQGVPTQNDQLRLFTTKTCPNCKMAKMFLEKDGYVYKNIDAEDPANLELVKKYDIKAAPTLVVFSGDSYTISENEDYLNEKLYGIFSSIPSIGRIAGSFIFMFLLKFLMFVNYSNSKLYSTYL